MRSKVSLVKALLIIAGVLIFIALLYMVLPTSASRAETAAMYASLADVSNVNSKSLFKQFSYEKTIVDSGVLDEDEYGGLTILKDLFTPEENKQEFAPSKFTAESITGLIEQANGETGGNTDFKSLTLNGSVYVNVRQTRDWATVQATSGSVVSSHGCMLFACAAAKSNLAGELYGVQNLLQDLGYTVSVNNAGNFSVSPKLPCVGLDSSKKYANGTTACTPQSIFGTLGISCSADKGNAFVYDNGIWLIHISNDSSHYFSSSGSHWFLIVGADNDYYYVVNGSGKAGEMGGKIEKKHLVRNIINHAYKVG